MIHFITGKPGGGKGVVAMQEIIEELRLGKRFIVTNLAVKMEPWVNGAHAPQIGLKAFLQRNFGETFDAEKRVRLLSDDEAKNFYLYRGGDVVIDSQKDDKGKITAYDAPSVNDSVLYVIDEVWKFFGSRDWQDTGKGLLFYNAQHRKLGDEVYLCTQNFKQVDTAVRQVTQDYLVVRNHGMEKLGIFRQPGVFTVTTFNDPPQGFTQQALSRRVFRLDVKGIAGCFDTSSGVGMGGSRAADMGRRRKGVNMMWAVAAAIVLVLVVARIPTWIVKGSAKVLGVADGTTKTVTRTNSPTSRTVTSPMVNESTDTVVPSSVKVSTQGSPRSVQKIDPRASVVPVSDEVFLVGLVRLGKRTFIQLSDGAYYEGDDPEVQLVTPKFVVILGKVYRWDKTPVRTEATADERRLLLSRPQPAPRIPMLRPPA